MEVPRNDEPRGEPGRHQELAIKYGLLSFLSNVTGAVFWWAEQKRWRLADQIELRRWQIADRLEELEVQR